MSPSDLKDLTIKWIDVVLSQSGDIWSISLAFFIASVLVIASLHGAQAQQHSDVAQAINTMTRKARIFMFFLVYVSAILSALSMVFAYFLKGEVIVDLQNIAHDGKWTVPNNYAVNSAGQVTSFWFGVVVFAVAFVMYRRIVGAALIGAIRG